MLMALQAFDTRATGASLRTIAVILFGEGDLAGDGQHRKSRARRPLMAGEAMVRAGPRATLAFPGHFSAAINSYLVMTRISP